MTGQRAHAYTEVVRLLDELGPAALHAHELKLVRDAADELLFSDDDRCAQTMAFTEVDLMLAGLVACDRCPALRAQRLRRALNGCAGPPPAAAQRRWPGALTRNRPEARAA